MFQAEYCLLLAGVSYRGSMNAERVKLTSSGSTDVVLVGGSLLSIAE